MNRIGTIDSEPLTNVSATNIQKMKEVISNLDTGSELLKFKMMLNNEKTNPSAIDLSNMKNLISNIDKNNNFFGTVSLRLDKNPDANKLKLFIDTSLFFDDDRNIADGKSVDGKLNETTKIVGLQLYLKGVKLESKIQNNYITEKNDILNNWIVASNTITDSSIDVKNSISIIYLECLDRTEFLPENNTNLYLCDVTFLEKDDNIHFYTDNTTLEYVSRVVHIQENSDQTFELKERNFITKFVENIEN